MFLENLPIGNDPPREVTVVIEVPIGGEPIKYELDKAAGMLVVDRFRYTPMRYPGGDERIVARPAPRLTQRYAHVQACTDLPEIVRRQVELLALQESRTGQVGEVRRLGRCR